MSIKPITKINMELIYLSLPVSNSLAGTFKVRNQKKYYFTSYA